GIQLVDPTTGQPFSGNIIPDDRISSVAKAFQDLVYPEPNRQGNGTFGLTQNYTKDPGAHTNIDVYSVRVDHNFSNRDALFVRVGFAKSNDDFDAGALNEGYGSFSFHGHHPRSEERRVGKECRSRG